MLNLEKGFATFNSFSLQNSFYVNNSYVKGTRRLPQVSSLSCLDNPIGYIHSPAQNYAERVFRFMEDCNDTFFWNYAEQEAGAKKDVGKGNAIVIRDGIREEYADDLPGKEVADQRQHGAEGKSKYQREFEGTFVSLPVFRTDTIAQQRLNALPKSDTDHAGHHGDLHSNAHTGYRHVAVFCHLTVHDDAGKAH